MRFREHMTLQDAAEALGVSEQTARRWVKSGKLDAHKPGLKYLIPKRAVEELLRPKAEVLPESRKAALAAGLQERGIEVNDSEVHVLDQYIALRKQAPTGPVAIWHVAKKDEPVDHERVKTLLAYVVASGMLTEDATEALREALHEELLGAKAPA